MCRAEGKPGGPRRCAKHMEERLTAARHAFTIASDAHAEAADVLISREARHQALDESGNADDRAIRRSQQLVRVAQADVRDALTLKRNAARHMMKAQADYDSTREGLQDLRALLDQYPDDEGLQRRYVTASVTYDSDATRREVEFGPQAPLSRRGIEGAGVVGKVLGGLRASAWFKSAASPDERTGFWSHRVNFVWRDAGRRKSLTVTTPTTSEVKRVEGETFLRGEPTMAEVCSSLDDQCRQVNDADTYQRWIEARGVRNSLAERQQWRAMQGVRDRLATVLSPDEMMSLSSNAR